MKNLLQKGFAGALCTLICLSAAFASGNETRSGKRSDRPLIIKAQPWGPTEADVSGAKARVERSPALRSVLKGAKYRLLSLQYIETEVNRPTRYRVLIYDYSNDRAFTAESDFAATESVSVTEHTDHAEGKFFPGVTREEILDARKVAAADAELAKLNAAGKFEMYDAMPPFTVVDGERLVNIGITKDGVEMIVGVSFKSNRVVYYKGGAPATSKAAPESCGIAQGNCFHPDCGNGFTGQAVISVLEFQGQNPPLWEMLVIRPAASSGRIGERSGVEVRDVKYKGKLVLKRGHVPVLNVNYTGDVCGPYRDWQDDEGGFMAPAAGAQNPANGIRILAAGQVATTSLDTGNDEGDFRGVAVYTQNTSFGNEVVMVSEMNAGWYRYLMEWRFAPDGTIRPRYGYGATKSSCVCAAHNHHTYWRFDFDIVNSANNIYQVERGRKFLRPILTESTILRNYGTNRGFVIQNAAGDEAYSITPGRSDGNADTYGQGDFWLLKFAGTPASPLELDDPNTSTAANFTPWLNGESLAGQDVVVWYAGHFIHNDGANQVDPARNGEILTGSHVVGPDLRPIRW